jgi:hypothetical protein
MEQRIFEGTWEELLSQSAEFRGQRLRVVVIENTEVPAAIQPTLDKLLAGRVGKVKFQPSDLSTRTGVAFAESLDEQHRSLGSNS